MIVIFFGPPGAGKGTQASLLSKHLKIPHLSTGEILRIQSLKKDKLGLELKNTLDKGELVTDKILNEIVHNRIGCSDCDTGFILDGYPRTMEQALFLDSILNKKKLKINKIIDIMADEETIISRIKLRADIENREDDKEEIIKTRISKYLSKTKPLSDYYKVQYSKGYYEVDGNKEIEEINKDIIKISQNLGI